MPVTVDPVSAERRLTRSMRAWLVIDSILVTLSGFQLFVLTEYTDRAFAWTIAPPLTAAFLGAAYFAALILVYGSSRQVRWEDARLAVIGVLVFTTLTLIATLLHLDRFHLAAPTPGARIAAWGWLAVYVVVPVALAILLVVQLRAPGEDGPRVAPLPVALRIALAAQATVLLVLGVVLFVAPTMPVWPWPLTPLTGRAVAAWLIGVGVIAAQAVWENEWRRVRVTMAGYAALGVLEIAALARYARFTTGGPRALVYLLFLFIVLGTGLYGWSASRRAGRAAARTAPGRGVRIIPG